MRLIRYEGNMTNGVYVIAEWVMDAYNGDYRGLEVVIEKKISK